MDWIAHPSCDATEATQIFSALREPRDQDECLVDLSRSRWVGPGMMASLAAFIEAQHRRGIPVNFMGPGNWDVRNYLSRMGIPAVLEELGVAHDLPTVRANLSLSERALVEVGSFSSEEDVERLIGIINFQNVADGLRRAAAAALLEAGCNVPEHARVECGYMAAQVLNGGTVLRLAVADAGIGVYATLQSVGATSEQHALQMAISGYSEKPAEEDGGRGLTSVHNSIKQHGGRGTLISGQSLVHMDPARLQGWTANVSSYRGTILDVVLPIQ